MQAYKSLPVFEDVAPALTALQKEHYDLYAFSNGSSEAVSTLLSNAGISNYFKGIVSVETVQQFKPSPRVYQHFNEVTNSSKSTSCLVSGNSFDVLGALSYGMQAVWVRRSPKAVLDPWKIEPNSIISNLTQLQAQIARIRGRAKD